MKTRNVVIVALAAMVSSTLGFAQGLTLDFANNTGDVISFGGASHTFNFNNGTDGFQWTITSEQGGDGAVGLEGGVNGGPFSYGPITSQFGGEIQYATVSGPLGDLVINDGTTELTGSVNWVDITTLYQSAGVFNASLQVNLTDVVYSGTNPDLQFLEANQPGSLDLSFQFSPGMSLTQLSSGAGPYETSYSGSISVVPEPSAPVLSALGGFGLLLLRRRK